jgi:hypothetical protein
MITPICVCCRKHIREFKTTIEDEVITFKTKEGRIVDMHLEQYRAHCNVCGEPLWVDEFDQINADEYGRRAQVLIETVGEIERVDSACFVETKIDN